MIKYFYTARIAKVHSTKQFVRHLFRIVVADSKSPRDGRFIEEIGTYDPTQEPSVYKVDEEAAKKWLANGAQPTDVVAKIFKLAGIEK